MDPSFESPFDGCSGMELESSSDVDVVSWSEEGTEPCQRRDSELKEEMAVDGSNTHVTDKLSPSTRSNKSVRSISSCRGPVVRDSTEKSSIEVLRALDDVSVAYVRSGPVVKAPNESNMALLACRPAEIWVCAHCSAVQMSSDLKELDGELPLFGDLKARFTCAGCGGGAGYFEFPVKRGWPEIAFVALINLAICVDGSPAPFDGTFHHLQTSVDSFIYEHFGTLCAGYTRNCWKSHLATALNRLPSHFEHSEGQQGKGWWRVRFGAAYPTGLDVLAPQPSKSGPSPWSRNRRSLRDSRSIDELPIGRKNKNRSYSTSHGSFLRDISSNKGHNAHLSDSDSSTSQTDGFTDSPRSFSSSTSNSRSSATQTILTPRLRRVTSATISRHVKQRSAPTSSHTARSEHSTGSRQISSQPIHRSGGSESGKPNSSQISVSAPSSTRRSAFSSVGHDHAPSVQDEWRLVEQNGPEAVNFVFLALRRNSARGNSATFIRELRKQFEAASTMCDLTGEEPPMLMHSQSLPALLLPFGAVPAYGGVRPLNRFHTLYPSGTISYMPPPSLPNVRSPFFGPIVPPVGSSPFVVPQILPNLDGKAPTIPSAWLDPRNGGF